MSDWAVMIVFRDRETKEVIFPKVDFEVFAMECSNPPPPVKDIAELIHRIDNPWPKPPTLSRKEIEQALNEWAEMKNV